jgi:DNA-binding IclR family transcriptional regulator
LMFLQGGYGRFSALSTVTDSDDDLGTHLRLAELARSKLEGLSAHFGVHAAAGALVGRQVIQLAWVAADGTDPGTDLVGLRLPFVAPFGLIFAAWEPDEVRDEWMRRHDAGDVRQALLEDLTRARSQGWAAIPDHAELRGIEESIDRLAAEDRVPTSVRELEDQIAGFARQYASLSGDRPRGVSAPVFGPAGRVVLTLTVQRLPEMDREQLDECCRALVTAAVKLTAVVIGES